MKIVVDNNVFISGIFWEGPPHEIIKSTEEGKIEISSSPEILEELFGVLGREKFKPYFRQAETTYQQVVQKILGLIKIYTPEIKIKIVKEDPDDNKFLECALACRASFIISGDKHLLKLKEFQGIPILTSREFLNRFNK